MGLSGQVPRRVDAATKAELLRLLDTATGAGWSVRSVCEQLGLGEVRAYRWLGRRHVGQLSDRTPGGSPMHALLEEEAAQIVALFHQWGPVDRSHRKLAHRGSYLGRVWVSPSSVRKVLAAHGLRLRGLPRPGRSVRKAFPVWADYRPNSIWIYDTTHFTAAGMAAVAVMDLVSRKWLTEIVSVEETSTQVAQVFTAAVHLEGMGEAVAAYQDTLVDPTVDDPAHPILLAVSDNGPQMTSVSTRAFMALNAIGQHFAPPRHPHRSGLDRDPVRTHQGRMATPARDPRPSRTARRARHRTGPIQLGSPARRDRLCDPERRARGPRPSDPQSPPNRTGQRPPTTPCVPPPDPPPSTRPRTRRCCLIPAESLSLTQKRLKHRTR